MEPSLPAHWQSQKNFLKELEVATRVKFVPSVKFSSPEDFADANLEVAYCKNGQLQVEVERPALVA